MLIRLKVVVFLLLAQSYVHAQCISYKLTKEKKTDSAVVTVHGRVTDLWGHGVSWTSVTIGPYSVQTDEQGHFSFKGIVPGKYQVGLRGYCSSSKKKAAFRAGQVMWLTVYMPKQDQHLPGLGIPGKDKKRRKRK